MSIKTELARLKQAKDDLKAALEEKGAVVSDTATVEDLVAAVSNIESDWSANPSDRGYIKSRTHFLFDCDYSILRNQEAVADSGGNISIECDIPSGLKQGDEYCYIINGEKRLGRLVDFGYLLDVENSYDSFVFLLVPEDYCLYSDSGDDLGSIGYSEFILLSKIEGEGAVEIMTEEYLPGEKLTLSIGKPITQKLSQSYIDSNWMATYKKESAVFNGLVYSSVIAKDGALPLVAGDKYIVRYHGEESTVTAIEISEEDGASGKYIFLGNASTEIGYTDNSCNFLIVVVPKSDSDGGYINVIAHIGQSGKLETCAGEHLLEIYNINDDVYNTIPDEYLDMDWIPKMGRTTREVIRSVATTINDINDAVDVFGAENSIPDIVNGGTYIITFNGHEFKATANVFVYNSQKVVLIGAAFINNTIVYDPVPIVFIGENGFSGFMFNKDNVESNSDLYNTWFNENYDLNVELIHETEKDPDIIPDELLGFDWIPRGTAHDEVIFTREITEDNSDNSQLIYEKLDFVEGGQYIISVNGSKHVTTARRILDEDFGDYVFVLGANLDSDGENLIPDDGTSVCILYAEAGIGELDGTPIYGYIQSVDSTLSLPITISITHIQKKVQNLIPSDFLGFDWEPRPTYVLPETVVTNNYTVSGESAMIMESDIGFFESSKSPTDTKGYVVYNGVEYPLYVVTQSGGEYQFLIPIDTSSGEYNYVGGSSMSDSLMIYNFVELQETENLTAKWAVMNANDGDTLAIIINATPLPDKYFPDSIPLRSPDGSLFRLSVDNNGNLSATKVETAVATSLPDVSSINLTNVLNLN